MDSILSTSGHWTVYSVPLVTGKFTLYLQTLDKLQSGSGHWTVLSVPLETGQFSQYVWTLDSLFFTYGLGTYYTLFMDTRRDITDFEILGETKLSGPNQGATFTFQHVTDFDMQN